MKLNAKLDAEINRRIDAWVAAGQPEDCERYEPRTEHYFSGLGTWPTQAIALGVLGQSYGTTLIDAPFRVGNTERITDEVARRRSRKKSQTFWRQVPGWRERRRLRARVLSRTPEGREKARARQARWYASLSLEAKQSMIRRHNATQRQKKAGMQLPALAAVVVS